MLTRSPNMRDQSRTLWAKPRGVTELVTYTVKPRPRYIEILSKSKKNPTI